MDQKKRITIYDLAEITGFSVGTVNRALNGKDRIKEETRRLILETAEREGYKANPAAQSLHRNPITIGVILHCPVQEYTDDIYRGIRVAAEELETYNVTVDIRRVPYTTSEECRDSFLLLLQEFSDRGYHGALITCALTKDETPDVIRKIDELCEAGIPVATVANDIPESARIFHVGIHAFLAGQMAAELLSLTCRDKDVVVLTSSMGSDVNSHYVEGFFDYAGEDTFRSIRVYSHYDEYERVLKETERMVEDNRELSGIYMTSASSSAACRYLQTMGRTHYRIIATDLLKDTPELLNDGIAFATIFQDPHRQGKTALMNLYNYIVTKKIERNNTITPCIVLASNAPLYRNWDE